MHSYNSKFLSKCHFLNSQSYLTRHLCTCELNCRPPKLLKQRYSKFSPLRFLDSQSYTNYTPVYLRSRLVHSKTFELTPPKRLTQLQNLALPLTNPQSYPNHTLVHLRSSLSYTRKHSILCF